MVICAAVLILKSAMNTLKNKNRFFIFCYIFFTLLTGNVVAQNDSTKTINSFPVIFNGDTLFTINRSIGAVTAEQRADAIRKKIINIAAQTNFNADSFRIEQSEISADIIYKDILVHSVFDNDVNDTALTRSAFATNRMLLISDTIKKYVAEHGVKIISVKILIAFAVLLFLILIIWLINKLFNFINLKVIAKHQVRFKKFHIGNYQLLSSEQIVQYAGVILKAFRIFITILIIYITLPVLFKLFPTTESIANYMWDLIWNPIKSMGNGIINYIPNLFALIVISFVFYYFTKLLNYFANEIANGKLVIKGFYAEWSAPTLSLVKFLVMIFYFIVSYRFLPGAESKVFQGVTVFLGLLVSIGSSSAISNIVAGLVITYMRPFKIGSFVKIGEVVGIVTEKNLLVTRVQTIKNEEITIPNATVLSSHILNYGNEKSGKLLIVHTTVTIGYNAPWQQVHELLINAALSTNHILAEPQPFVLQTGLNDFYISYQINAYTDMPTIQASILSSLHQNIQDKFNEAGVEIMSPHYSNLRDGNQTSIPENYLHENYKAPRFNVAMDAPEKKDGSKQMKLNL